MNALLRYAAVAVGAVAFAAGGLLAFKWITDESDKHTIRGTIDVREIYLNSSDCSGPRMVLEDSAGAEIDSVDTRSGEGICEYSFMFRDVPGDLPRYVFVVEGERGDWRYTSHALERNDWEVALTDER
jgi:hypothetical protein